MQLNTKLNASITAVGGYVPEHRLSNKDLEQIVDTNDEWIQSRTGIKERRILKDPSKATSFLAIQASKNLISKNNIDPLTIDMVIVATTTPDMQIAATAAYVASEIGSYNAFGYDLQAACSGFLYAMSMASGKIESGRYKKVLVVGADKMSSVIDYKDRSTCILFGDGAGAVLFESNNEGLGWQDEYFKSNGDGRESLNVKAGGSLFPATSTTISNRDHYLRQDGRKVFKTAVSAMSDASSTILKRNNLVGEDIDYLVAHQANERIIESIAKRMSLKPSKVLKNIAKYGNTTAATIPLLLYDFQNKFKRGNKIIFAAFGGGFTWGAAYYIWSK
ncbi:MAG: 3-oxoacyl-ACP synthase [Flavobacteriaceae bacterium]|nr:3-oxoacyl-ACP synthase [Flavobacteriaceae bacterium]